MYHFHALMGIRRKFAQLDADECDGSGFLNRRTREGPQQGQKGVCDWGKQQ